jgi:phosphoglycerol transferase MdoB-like AlkP superfamily enzyme
VVSAPALDRPALLEVDEGEPSPASPPQSHRRTLALSLVVSFLAALVCAGLLETPLWWNQTNPVLATIAVVSKPLDVLVVWLLMALLVALTSRLWLSVGVLLVITGLATVINVGKMSILAEPVFPSDTAFLRTPTFLFSMVSPVDVVLALASVPLVIWLSVLAGHRAARRYPSVSRRADRRLWTRLAAGRLVVVVLTAGLLASTVHFNQPGNLWRKLYDAQGAAWLPFSQQMNYRTNGFIGGLLYNMPTEAMERPADYNAETMARIAQRYTERAEARNVGRTPGALDDVNVVVVLSESYADPTRLEGITLDRDPIPLTRQNIDESWGGSALANFYGTGTSSMEFQALTGQTLALFEPQIVAPYQNFMTDLSDYPSAVGWFHEHGHRAVAVHPYTTEMYRRKTIYRMLGFDEFVHDDSMQEQDKLEHNTYISDHAAFDEVQERIGASDDPLLVNLVTMQNHVPMSDWYDDPVGVTGDASDSEKESIGGFARGLEYSDEALDLFLRDLEASDEQTVVVFYGDHYPGIFGDSLLDQNPGLGQLETPLLIWSNRGQEPRPLPITSSNQFLPYAFDLVGEPLPPYYELISEVTEQIGALAPGRIVAPDGAELSRDDLSAAQKHLLHDYELVQYDFSIGKRYAVDDMWYQFD